MAIVGVIFCIFNKMLNLFVYVGTYYKFKYFVPIELKFGLQILIATSFKDGSFINFSPYFYFLFIVNLTKIIHSEAFRAINNIINTVVFLIEGSRVLLLRNKKYKQFTFTKK